MTLKRLTDAEIRTLSDNCSISINSDAHVYWDKVSKPLKDRQESDSENLQKNNNR